MKKLLYLLVFLVIVGIGAYFFFENWYSTGIENRVSDSQETVRFDVESGEGTSSIGARLKEEQLIENDLLFKLYLKRENKGGVIQAGEFEIPRNSNIVEIVEILSNARELDIVRVTLIEGYTTKQIGETLASKFTSIEGAQFSKAEFDKITRDPDAYDFSEGVETFLSKYKPTGNRLEGFLYPDTYEFENEITTLDLIDKLVQQFITKTASIDKTDFYDNLILASIVERESLTNEERPKIASVFHNRLGIGMALESDATVNYATGKSTPQATYEDLRIDSPYNTYKYPGLPPTPISNPRIESLQAAVNPADTDYYFFLHEQDGTGEVHFARTLAEHNRNRALYLD